MASINELYDTYMETKGVSIIIGIRKKTGKYWAWENNKRLSWEADNIFALADQLISYMKKVRKESKIKYEIE